MLFFPKIFSVMIYILLPLKLHLKDLFELTNLYPSFKSFKMDLQMLTQWPGTLYE